MGGTIRMDQSFSKLQKLGQNRWRADGTRVEHLPRIRYVAAQQKVKSLLDKLVETPESFTGRILFMSMCNDISCGTKDNEQECLASARPVSFVCKKNLVNDNGHIHWSWFWKEVVLYQRDSPQGIWDNIAEKMLVEFRRKQMSNFSVLRLHCPEVNSKGKDMVNCRPTMQPSRKRLRLFFA